METRVKNSTIAAISTANGTAALGIIRVTGKETFEFVAKCLVNKEKFFNMENRRISLQLIKNQETEEIIDEVTIIKYGEPKSFTGEDMVEIICHGGKIIVEKIFIELKKTGIESAAKGEFSKRAFLNGKIDLMKAEAINGMIHSNNEINRKIAVRSYQGGCVEFLNKITNELNCILVEIESEIEFEEEDDVKAIEKNNEKIGILKKKLESEIRKRKRVKEVEKGYKIIIAGPTNAGKSTLFNKILRYERSITFDEPGTTRDIVTEKININGLEITLTDTAGIRDTENKIEKIGIQRSIEEIQNANLIVWVSAINENLSKNENELISKIDRDKVVILLNKNDMEENKGKVDFYNSNSYKLIKTCFKNENSDEIIINEIETILSNCNVQNDFPEFITNQRQEEIAERILEQINLAIDEWKRKEIVAHHLHNALDSIEEILGKRDREDMYNKIFETFCIGK